MTFLFYIIHSSLRHAVIINRPYIISFYYRTMPLFKAVKQNLLPRTSMAAAREGEVTRTGTPGLLPFGRASLMIFKDHNGSEGPFPPIAKEINHAV
jgi:hypothetical protein